MSAKATLSIAVEDQQPDIWQIQKTNTDLIFRFVEGNRFGFHEISVDLKTHEATIVKADGSTMTTNKMNIDDKGYVDMLIENFI